MIRRGEIYFVSLDPVNGREQAGTRPVLVVSSDSINRLPLVVSVVVGTDASNVDRDYPTNVRMTAAETGLPRDTVFLCFHLRSLDPGRFRGRRGGPPLPAGHAPQERLRQVYVALALVLEMDAPPEPRPAGARS